ncbi:hypothetical protein D3C80_1823820 [compost metagenome]
MTERPTSDEACKACEEPNALEMLFTEVFNVVMPSRLLNWANCATNALLSCGSSGFWFLSWVTSNCRNASLPSSFLPVLLLVAAARPSLLVVDVFFEELARMSLRLRPLVVSVTLI